MNRRTAVQRLTFVSVIALTAMFVALPREGQALAAQPETRAAAIGTPTFKWSRCWPSWCETGWYASPAVADIDGDGQAEVLWGGYTLMAVNGATGAVEWTYSSPGGGRLWPGIVIADIDDDGDLEIVTGNGVGYISVLNANGAPYPGGWPIRPTGTGNELRSLAVANVDGNGDLEIVVCSTRSDNQWFVYEHNGALRSGWPKMTDSDSNGYAAGCFNENVGVADIDGDGRGEIVGPNDTHYTAAFNDDGSPVRANIIYGTVGGQNKPWARVGVHVSHDVDLRGYAMCGTEHRPNFANSAPSIADLNRDGVLEIVIVGNVYNCGTNPYTDLYEMPFIFKADRTRWSGSGFDWTAIPPDPGASGRPLSEDYNVIENSVPNPVLADLDGDGYKEILFPSYDGRLHAYWLDKTEKYNWPFEVHTSGAYRFASEPAVADLDGDGKAEVIFTTWTQKNSNQRGELKIVDWQGNQLQSVQLPASSSSWDGAMPAPTLANIDGDADLEVLIGTAHTGLVAYDLPGTANANVLWGTGRGGHQRTGQALIGEIAGAMWSNTIAPAPGEVITFTLALRNEGSAALSGARMTDTLPSLLSYARGLAATSGSAGRSGGTITWTGNVSSSATVSVTFAVTVSSAIVSPTIIVNTATLDDNQGTIRTIIAGLGVNAYRVYLPTLRK